MDISLIVDILILAALLYIAYKLHAIALFLFRFLERTSRDRDARDSSPSAQTINVNVSPASGSASSGPSVVVPLAVASAGAPEGSDRPSSSPTSARAADLPSSEPAAGERKASASGPFSVQCSRCHAENSSYRTECFNCGNPL